MDEEQNNMGFIKPLRMEVYKTINLHSGGRQ